jgi:K+-sensing histidine kinase KdpD
VQANALIQVAEDQARETAARLLAAETDAKQTEVRARAAEEQGEQLAQRLQVAEEQASQASERLMAAQAQAQQAELRMRAADEKAKEATKRMQAAEDEANQATAGGLVAETKVKQAEVRARAVEDQSAQTVGKNAELLEQLQQARGELVGAEERVRMSEEQSQAASERVAVLEGQIKELKVRIAVAKTELPVGAVTDKERSTLQDAVATEVRRPLTSILGVSLALRHGDPDSRDGQELVKQLTTNARKLDRMVGVLLELDRLADGSLRAYRRRTDLQALVRRVVEESPDMAGRNVHVQAEKVVVAVDPTMTEQMVETLLTNASERTSPGGPVWITVSSDPEGAIIAVDDTGSEVPEGLLKALSASPEEQKRGAGRGRVPTSLTVLQRLAEVHAGRAWIEEREGGGASFRVFLPEMAEVPKEGASQAAADETVTI